MKITRKKFLRNLLMSFSGSLLFPFFFNSKINAKPELKLKYKPQPQQWQNDSITLSWIGHSTILINLFGKWILTDPVLFERVGIYLLGTSYGPTRISPPALDIDEIPQPDIILLSHAHMDHMDYPTLKYLSKKFPHKIDVITAYNTKDVIKNLDWHSINVLDWNEEKILHGIRFKALEVKHFGWRFPWEKDRSRGFFKDGRSFNAYIIELNGKKILFGGDTAFTDKLKKSKEENIDIAIMPIGAYNPWKRNHCNPEEALKMATELKAKYFIPIHTKTFKLGIEPINEPIEWLRSSAPKYPLKIALDEIGMTFQLKN
ncbi:MBL fold metallo-hydrolase [Rosettibacter firmus]|uniref:MBL fold metallo-hydrolase n=1 Tax=Rosettibacter firmus TaxID=3111522 RepID=UPI00336C2DA4